MGMPRFAIAAILALTAGGAAAQANCKLADNEVLRDREKWCASSVIKVACDGSPVDVVARGRSCCKAPENRVIEWRCGGEAEPELFCPPGATALLVNPTADGARFRCLKLVAAVENVLGQEDGDPPQASDPQPENPSPPSLFGQDGS